MKIAMLFSCLIFTVSWAIGNDQTPIPLKFGLQNINLTENSGSLLSGDDCSATYEIDTTNEYLIVTVKKVIEGRELTAKASFGPQVLYQPFLSSYALTDVNSNSSIIYSPTLKEVRTVNIYADIRLQCVVSLPLQKENRAIMVNLTSKGGAFDSTAEQSFYQYIGTKISDQSLEQVKVTGYGDEGGKFYCLEINHRFYGKRL
ncbi:MAG: hypothetical protein Q7U04_05955, partial [Bacteriovorax sp.]|nr:hypothetical protein [Bacteriovorax sp.]